MKTKVQQLREVSGLSVPELAHRAGLHPAVFSRIEKGGDSSLEEKEKISSALGVLIHQAFPKDESIRVLFEAGRKHAKAGDPLAEASAPYIAGYEEGKRERIMQEPVLQSIRPSRIY